MKNIFYFILVLFSGTFIGLGQGKYEQEFRIRKSQFPENALVMIQDKLDGVKRLKFYKEIDSANTNFEAKFKKAKLWYNIVFNEDGILETIEIRITEVDIPTDAFSEMTSYLNTYFDTYKIKSIQQQYPSNSSELLDITLKNAFQNMLLPSINYKFSIAGKKDKKHVGLEAQFDAQGKFKNIKQSLPANYDHVLY
ncbi:hypothetical protein ACOCEA_06170 [Maribacter sp. CXY002]|uniref:hypothetical protein n=1 Tax=Maribacter luteocoastalis TaxID=3407671 RepID=UPI003B6821EF